LAFAGQNLIAFLEVRRGLANIVPMQILKLVGAIAIPARTAKFVPKDSYVVNIKPGSHAKIGYIDPDFLAWFGEKAEEPTAPTTLRRYVLTCPSTFAPAMKEIAGGGVSAKTTPAELYSMMEKQPDGPKSDAGPLLTNRYANLFEMDDASGVSRLVHAYWDDNFGGWCVVAGMVANSSWWGGGCQVFSRDSR
jgi:hypothetical protein